MGICCLAEVVVFEPNKQGASGAKIIDTRAAITFTGGLVVTVYQPILLHSSHCKRKLRMASPCLPILSQPSTAQP